VIAAVTHPTACATSCIVNGIFRLVYRMKQENSEQ